MRRLTLIFLAVLASPALLAAEIAFRDQELPTKLTVGYAVRLVDMNDDKRPDICIVDSDRILWLENPTWAEHVILQGQTKRDNVCFAPHDIDGDGRIDFAVGAAWQPGSPEARKSGGSIDWITGGKMPVGPWTLHRIDEYPTTHRMNFADLDANGRPELIVSPLQGRDTTPPNYAEHGTPLLVYQVPADPVTGPWTHEVRRRLHRHDRALAWSSGRGLYEAGPGAALHRRLALEAAGARRGSEMGTRRVDRESRRRCRRGACDRCARQSQCHLEMRRARV
jgi:hypothetical protein